MRGGWAAVNERSSQEIKNPTMKTSTRMVHAGCLALLAGAVGTGATPAPAVSSPAKSAHRFFSDDSFWNQPIPAQAEVDPRTARWIKLLETEPTGLNFLINSQQWTIPIYEVDRATPLVKVGLLPLTPKEQIHWHTDRGFFGHGSSFAYLLVNKQILKGVNCCLK